MYYNNKLKQITLEYNSNESGKVILYKSHDILYQTWNSIVINNNYGSVDLFINGNLVGSYKHNIDYKITDDELLQIGDENNNNIGGITDFYYYETPLNLEQINKIYKNKQ